MRKVLLLLYCLLLFCYPLSSQPLSSQNDAVVRIILLDKFDKLANNKANHAPAKTLIEGYYYSMTSSVELSFLSNLGAVTVLLENITDGDIRDYVGNSSNGRMIFPVASNSTYRMTITSENGRTYYASFFTESEND